MKAAVFYSNGGPEVFRYEDVDDPDCGPEDVVIRMEAASIERLDIVSRQSRPLPRIPHVVGCQCAGEVVRTGSMVLGRQVGQHVVACMPWGSHAELVKVPERNTWLVPQGLRIDKAATVPIQFGIAHDALIEFGKVERGETVLVHDAASGRGLISVQIAKMIGARVLTTISGGDHAARLYEMGADLVIDRSSCDFVDPVFAATAGRGADAIVETTGGELLVHSIEALSYRGRIVVATTNNPVTPLVDAALLAGRNSTIMGAYFPNTIDTEFERLHGVIADYLDRVAATEFLIEIDSIYSLASAADAHRRATSTDVSGSVLLVPGP